MMKKQKLGFLLLIATAFSAMAAPPPNVLFVICDDLNDSIEGMGGHPQARTPNIDRFMQSAVRFDSAHANVPICGPSRASLWSGLYPHTSGYYGWAQNPAGGGDRKNPKMTFERPVLNECTTLIQNFARNGYTVFGTGKITHEYHRDAGLFDNIDGTRNWAFSPVTQGPGPSTGETMANGLLKSARTTNFMPKELANIGAYFGPLSDVPDIPADPKKGTPGYKGWMDWGAPFRYASEEDRDLMADEKSANYAIEVLKKNHDKPFFLAVGFCRPHTPLVAPKKYFDLFKDVEIQLPPYKEKDLNDCAEILWQNSVPKKYFDAVRSAGIETWKEWIRAYLACTAFVDDQFGRVFQALENSPYAGNTIVIFTSDHGMHLGEKDMLAKMTLWAESTRVPLLVRTPGMQTGGAICSRPVSLIDLYPTLADCCDLPKPSQALDGTSLRPLLADPGGSWDGPDAALVAWMGAPTQEQREHPYMKADAGNQHFALVSDHWRYIRASNGEEELYDLSADPNEWTNLASNPEMKAILERMRGLLKQRLGSGQ
jgi:arylsulfatase A-like enzyme